MNNIFTALLAVALCVAAVPASAEPAGKKPLIVYFTWSGNSAVLASHAQRATGGDVFQAEAAEPYPIVYRATTQRARQEQDANARPALKVTQIPNLDAYDTVILIHPNWWGTIPMPLMTLLEANDLSGKKIAQLVTHEGSGVARSNDDLRRACPGAEILKPLAVRGGVARGASREVAAWLREVGIAK